MTTVTVWRRVCAAGECTIAELHVRGFLRLQVLSMSALGRPVDTLALMVSGLLHWDLTMGCNMAPRPYAAVRARRMGMCCRLARWAVGTESFTWGVPQNVC